MPPIESITVAGKDALSTFERLRAERATTGLIPIFLGEPVKAREILSVAVPPETVAATLDRGLKSIEPQAWFLENALHAEEPIADPFAEDDAIWSREHPRDDAEIEGHQGLPEIVGNLALGQKRLPDVAIALVAAEAPWEVFAQLDWGAWNDCPPPEVHVALHRDWARRYGAEVVCVTRDVVQCLVASPPSDPEAALQLAREQYTYCNDIVDQGTETVEALAAGLLNARSWSFWWD